MTQKQSIEQLKKYGFGVSPHTQHCINIDDVIKIVQQWGNRSNHFSYPVDGAVVKVNEKMFYQILGETIKSPRWAIAYKFKSEQVETVIKDIVWQVGRLGTVTPVAQFESVFLDGTIVKRASLHNIEEIQRKDIRKNDRVVIEKAGGIIPQVVHVCSLADSKRNFPTTPPDFCPSCKSPLYQLKKEVALRCTNSSCSAQKLFRLEYYCSREAMNIEGLGHTTLKQLIEHKLVEKITDLYLLKRDELLTLDSIAEKKADNIVKGIEKSKKKSFSHLLYALGIRHVGKKVSRDLANVLCSISTLLNADLESLEKILSIGPVIASSVYAFFNNPENQRMMVQLKAFGLNLSHLASPKTNSPLEGLNFVITGKLPTLGREEATLLIEENNGIVRNTISSTIDYIIVGNDAGGKKQRAEKLNIPQLSEQNLLDLIRNRK